MLWGPWHVLGFRCQNQTGVIGFQKENGIDLNKSQPVYFRVVLSWAYLGHSTDFSKLNWCHIFALMWALPPTLWAGRVAGVAPETLLCESLQPCVKGKHVLHSESQGSLSRLISEMKCFPPPALTIEASALAQTNPSRIVCTCAERHRGTQQKGLFFSLMSSTLSASCLVCW